jgi:hypothetical protein
MAAAGKLEQLKLKALTPDWQNPRFPPGASDRFTSDQDVYAFLDAEFNAFAVADSIAEHGFFESEPLIAIPEGRLYTVLEGNRRLAALRALSDPEIRSVMTDPRWREIPKKVSLPERIPVLVAESREAVAPILGFRHITGIAPWSPFQQARFVATMIDDDQMDAERVAELVGRSVSEVRAFYRNYSIAQQARDVFEIPDVGRVLQEFGVWTRAMTSAGARGYIEAPAPREVVEGEYPLPGEAKPRLENLITWLFGVPRTKSQIEEGLQSKEGRAIEDSRKITSLGKALQHPKGVAALEAGQGLEDAERAMLDKRAHFISEIEEGKEALERASENRPKRLTRSAEETLEEIGKLAKQIRLGDGDARP